MPYFTPQVRRHGDKPVVLDARRTAIEKKVGLCAATNDGLAYSWINGMNRKWISSLQRIHIHATVASLHDDGKKCWKLEIISWCDNFALASMTSQMQGMWKEGDRNMAVRCSQSVSSTLRLSILISKKGQIHLWIRQPAFVCPIVSNSSNIKSVNIFCHWSWSRLQLDPFPEADTPMARPQSRKVLAKRPRRTASVVVEECWFGNDSG